MKRPSDYIGLGVLLAVGAILCFANDVAALGVVLAIPAVVLVLVGTIGKGVSLGRRE